MKKRHPIYYQILLALCCAALMFSGCRSVEDDSVSLATIQVTPSDTSMNEGEVVQLTAARLYTNLATSDCSDVAAWSSSDTTVASFSATANGMLSALAAGTTTIRVTCSGKSKTYTLTVDAVPVLQTIEVTPLSRSIANLSRIILTAIGTYSDGTTVDLTNSVSWSSDTPANVSVERSSGSDSIQASALVANTSAVISAQYEGVTGSTTINVHPTAAPTGTLIVTPVNPDLVVGDRLYVRAAMLYDNDSVQDITDWAEWSSNNAAVAVSNVDNGLAEAITTGGPITITADDGAVTTGTTTITVGSDATLDYIEVYPRTLTMDVNTSEQFTAVGIYADNTVRDLTKLVSWTSSDTSLLSINSSHRYHPRATALAEGTVFLSASLPGSSEGASATITISDRTLSTIEVTPTNPSLPDNLDVNFKATGFFSDGTRQDLTQSVVWSSSDTAVLIISNAFQIKGQARGLTDGTSTVTATFGSTNGTAAASVSTAITLSSVDISPPLSDVPDGYRGQLTATGIYSDGNTYDLTPYIAWQSGASITVDNLSPWQGVARTTAVVGIVTVDANFLGANGQDVAVTGTADVNTTNATLSSIDISPGDPTCIAGYDKQFTATGIFSDSSTLDITKFVVWKSSDAQVATASNAPGVQGKFPCRASGSANITAASGSVSGTTTVYVSDP